MSMHSTRLMVAALVAAAPITADTAFSQEQPAAQQCTEAGQGFKKIGDLNLCLRPGLDVTAEVGHHFARYDLHVETLRTHDRLPSAAYESVRRSFNKHEVVGTLLVRPIVTLFAPTDLGPLSVHVRASSSSTAYHLNDVSSAPVFLDDAWASLGPWTVGRRFSFFDYNPGFTYKPGYASYRTTNLLAFSAPVGDGMGATLSLEDPSLRQREDGVWGVYGDSRLPDLVAAVRLGRSWGNAQASFALHEIPQADLLGCACTDAGTVGVAASAGVEYRQKFGETYGRILLAGAAADGALDYLGIPYYAPDFVTDADGAVRTTKGVSALASYEHVWRPDLRTAVSLSWYGTTTPASDLRWDVQGYLAQATIEYMPAPNVLVGAEAGHLSDAVKGDDAFATGVFEKGSTNRFLFYVRRFF